MSTVTLAHALRVNNGPGVNAKLPPSMQLEAVAKSKIFWPCTCEGQLVPILRGCRAMDAGPLVSAGPPLLACLQ